MPVANRVVVQQQGLRDALAAPALVEKDNGVGSPGDAMLLKPVSGKPDQSSTVCRRKKPAANHVHSRILIDGSVKRFFAYSMSRGIATAGNSLHVIFSRSCPLRSSLSPRSTPRPWRK